MINSKVFDPLRANSKKMVEHTQPIRRQQPTNCLSVFVHFVELALEGLTLNPDEILIIIQNATGFNMTLWIPVYWTHNLNPF